MYTLMTVSKNQLMQVHAHDIYCTNLYDGILYNNSYKIIHQSCLVSISEYTSGSCNKRQEFLVTTLHKHWHRALVGIITSQEHWESI